MMESRGDCAKRPIARAPVALRPCNEVTPPAGCTEILNEIKKANIICNRADVTWISVGSKQLESHQWSESATMNTGCTSAIPT